MEGVSTELTPHDVGSIMNGILKCGEKNFSSSNLGAAIGLGNEQTIDRLTREKMRFVYTRLKDPSPSNENLEE